MSKRLALGALAACVAVALGMAAFGAVPGGRHYEYAILLTLSLTAISALAQAPPRVFFGPGVAAGLLVCGLALGAVNFAVLRPDSEIVETYRTVFAALDAGKNPYTSGTIHHEIEGAGAVLGNFNYPPLEIYPYDLARRIAGRWDLGVLTATLIVIQSLCGLALFFILPRVPPLRLLAFLPFLVLGEIKTNVAMTFLLIVLVLAMIRRDRDRPGPVNGAIIAVLFGLGLMTKFLVVPLLAAYYAHRWGRGDRRARAVVGVDICIALAVAAALAAPFGVLDVLRSTLLFNVVLEDRAVMTTFYPNVLSGPLTWLGLQAVYPFAAAAVLAAAVLAAPRLRLLTAMTAAAVVSLLVGSTPEPQFLPPLFFLVVVGQGLAAEDLAISGDTFLRRPAAFRVPA